MQITKDTWLSNLLKKDTFKIEFDSHFKKEDLDIITNDRKAFYYTKINDSIYLFGLREALVKKGFIYIDLEFRYKFPDKNIDKGNEKNENFNIVSFDSIPIKYKDKILEIAETSFSNSRFHQDEFIDNETANKIKREWAESYVTGLRGDCVFIALNNNIPAGFLLSMFDESKVVIDLIVVEKSYRNKGVASLLIETFINAVQFIDKKVGTQSSNLPAVNLYKSFGCELVEMKSIFHLHTGENINAGI